MTTALMLALLLTGQTPEEKLLARLDASFEKTLENDPHAEQMRTAARLLQETNQSDRWTNYSSASKIIRETRSKAGIPLLLAYMVRHSTYGSSHVSVPHYADTLTVLTGKDIPNPYQYVADRKTPVLTAVEKLATGWWEPQQDKISTDIKDWSDAQLQVLAAQLLKGAAFRSGSTNPSEWKSNPTSYAVYHLLYYQVMHAGSDRPSWDPAELHPKMVPQLLAGAGYRKDPKEAPSRDTSRPAYEAVAMLADLRMNGEFDELDEIAEDANQSAGTRLTCVMALFRANEKLRTDILLSILETDRNLERRLVAILALRYAEDDRPAGAALVKLLDDENAEIRTAAVCALRGPLPPQAIPKLKGMIDNLDTPPVMLFIFDVLGHYKHRDACEALAGFIAAGLEDPRKEKHLYYAISGLEAATGQRWGQAGPQKDEFYRKKAEEAVKWWDDVGRKSFK